MANRRSTRRAAIYARVSTNGQSTDAQILQLRDVAQRSGWDVVEEFVDHGLSGAKGRDQRPAFDQMCQAAVRREIDVVMAWSVDRLGRSLLHLVEFLNELHASGTDLYLHQQGIDTTTPAGKAMFQMSAVFAEFERAMISDRVKAGLERARLRGKKLGRPKVSSTVEDAILAARAEGKGIRRIAGELGVGVGTVQRVIAG